MTLKTPRFFFPLPFRISLAVLFIVLSLQGQYIWFKARPKTSPSGRRNPCMVFDPARGKAVLFGGWGCGSTSLPNDTWEFDGKTWSQIKVSTAPPGREEAAMVFDSWRKKIVLFGGRGSSKYLGDTWVWDGKTWIQMHPAQSPPPRFGHAMAFDPVRGKIVLFGGNNYKEDTWEWDGKDWSQMKPTKRPSPRYRHAMAFDPIGKRVILFGGQGSKNPLGDTWEWDGKNWIKMAPKVNPAARALHRMAFNPDKSRVILFGGVADPREVWEWDGKDWSKRISFVNPSVRWGFGMDYDTYRHKMVIFGGSEWYHNQLNETWELLWMVPTFKTYGKGCPGSNKSTPLLLAKTPPKIGTTFTLEIKNAPILTWTFLALGIQTTNFSLTPYGAPGCTLYTNPDFVFPNSTNLTGVWSLPHQFRIPMNINLLGGVIPFQVMLADHKANLLGLTVSNAAKATIGL